jgi:hypothetical protein
VRTNEDAAHLSAPYSPEPVIVLAEILLEPVGLPVALLRHRSPQPARSARDGTASVRPRGAMASACPASRPSGSVAAVPWGEGPEQWPSGDRRRRSKYRPTVCPLARRARRARCVRATTTAAIPGHPLGEAWCGLYRNPSPNPVRRGLAASTKRRRCRRDGSRPVGRRWRNRCRLAIRNDYRHYAGCGMSGGADFLYQSWGISTALRPIPPGTLSAWDVHKCDRRLCGRHSMTKRPRSLREQI